MCGRIQGKRDREGRGGDGREGRVAASYYISGVGCSIVQRVWKEGESSTV